MPKITGLDILRNTNGKVTTKQAAEYLGESEMFIRCGLRAGALPIGSCQRTNKEYAYHISPYRLVAYQEGEAMLQKYLAALESESQNEKAG